MEPHQRQGRRLAAVVIGVVALLAVAWWLAREPRATEPEAAPDRTSDEDRPRAGSDDVAIRRLAARPAPPVRDAGAGDADARRVYFPGRGWATVTDPDPDNAPPPIDELPVATPPEPPPEPEPVTAAWSLQKGLRLQEILQQRVERLEGRLQAATEDDERRRLEILLARTHKRIERLDEDIEALREQAAREAEAQGSGEAP